MPIPRRDVFPVDNSGRHAKLYRMQEAAWQSGKVCTQRATRLSLLRWSRGSLSSRPWESYLPGAVESPNNRVMKPRIPTARSSSGGR